MFSLPSSPRRRPRARVRAWECQVSDSTRGARPRVNTKRRPQIAFDCFSGGVPEFPAELPTREELDKLNKFRAGDYSEIVDALNFNKGAPGSAKKERPLTPG